MEFLTGFDYIVMKVVQWPAVLGNFMDLLFAAFTFLGEETFLIVVVLVVYWGLDKRRGEYLLFSLYGAIATNGFIKDIVRRPRPFLTAGFEDTRYVLIDTPLVNTVKLGESYSFPSAHAQCSGSLFSALWLSGRRGAKKAWLSGLAVLLVMLSRIYLGVHFPTDVLAGAVLGVLMSLLMWWVFEALYDHRLILFGAAVAISFGGLLFSASLDSLKTAGLGAGVLLGMIFEHKFTHFRVEGSTWGRILRVALGALLVLAVKEGLKLALPDGAVFEMIRYGVIGLTATGLWPWCFTKMGL